MGTAMDRFGKNNVCESKITCDLWAMHLIFYEMQYFQNEGSDKVFLATAPRKTLLVTIIGIFLF